MSRTNGGSLSRRSLLGAGLAGAGLVGCRAGRANGAQVPPASDVLALDVAGYAYDRVQALADGRVGVEGCRVRFEADSISAMNRHAFEGPRSREVTEIGLSPFLLAYANEGFRAYTLLPVFPLRLFRHRSIFVRADGGLERPEDLRGRRIATPGYSSTSLTWIRGMLQHEHGVAPGDVRWVVSAEDSSVAISGRASAQEQLLPAGLAVERGAAGLDESDLLVEGEVDALFHAAEPRAFAEGDPRVRRLFPDVRAAERAYFARTGIFPIMHAVAVRRDACEAHPWLPEAVCRAYVEAKHANERAMQMQWVMGSLPWYAQELEATRELMGRNYWPYGLEANRTALEALVRYSHEQGLAQREVALEELFHPATLEWVEEA